MEAYRPLRPEEFELLPATLYNMKETKFGNLRAERKGALLVGGEEHSCMICLAAFQTGDPVITLRCLDVFHRDCAQNWLVKKNGCCPCCRVI